MRNSENIGHIALVTVRKHIFIYFRHIEKNRDLVNLLDCGSCLYIKRCVSFCFHKGLHVTIGIILHVPFREIIS